ncbi:MAG: hypothetical protein IPK83_04100 [Planctomycetes bacterium]|nr:hypothetical protein [Planctomycetota bacterium]
MQASYCPNCGRELAVLEPADVSQTCPDCAKQNHVDIHEAKSGLDQSDVPITLSYAASKESAGEWSCLR